MQSKNTLANRKGRSFLSLGWQGFHKAGDAPPLTTNDSLKALAGIGLTSAAIGGAGRGLFGLRDLIRQQMEKRRAISNPSVVEVRVPEVHEEEEEIPVRRLSRQFGYKAAETPATPSLVERIFPFISKNFWSGQGATSHTDKPWFLPAATAATLGGLYGGYKGVNYGIDTLHRHDKEKELEDAKDEYRKALIEQYTTDSPAIKRSEAQSDLGQALDELYDLCKDEPAVKIASAGSLTGAYLTLAALLAGTTGAATYNWAKARSPDDQLVKAIKQRERLRVAAKPPEIYAVTRPSPAAIRNTSYSTGTDEDRDAINKIAALYKP